MILNLNITQKYLVSSVTTGKMIQYSANQFRNIVVCLVAPQNRHYRHDAAGIAKGVLKHRETST